MKRLLSKPGFILLPILLFASQAAVHAQTTFAVGQKVDAGGGYRHKATVLQAKPPSYFLHYDDGSLPDGWEQGYSMRPRTGDSGPGVSSTTPSRPGSLSASSTTSGASSPRNGKYSIYVYDTWGHALYNGYFVLNGSSYEVFLPGGKPGGSGQCRFDVGSSTMRWVSGPFANPDWNGTQKFEVDGNNQKIRLRRNTVGWSTGS